MAPKNMLFSLPLTDIYVNIYGHVGRRITVGYLGNMSIDTPFLRSSSSSDETLLLSRRQIFGQRFRLLECLGRGGFGQVWRVKDIWLNQEVALKISAKDMRTETLLLRRLPKDRYVSIFDYVKDSSTGAVAYAMEVLDPPWVTLERHREISLLPKFDKGHFVKALRETLCISIDLLISLQKLHGEKYKKTERWYHADIKPQNIYVHSKEVTRVSRQHWGDRFVPFTKISDLGLSRRGGTRLAGGTERFMAPEQDGSPATDIFSVGQTIATLILGCPLCDEDLAHIKRLRNRFKTVIPSAYLAEKLVKIIREMTLKTPSLRPKAVDSIKKLRKVVESENDWQILAIFARSPSGLTISEAGEELFYKLAKSRGWRNFTKERAKEMNALVRSSYRRKLLMRNGHSYTIST